MTDIIAQIEQLNREYAEARTKLTEKLRPSFHKLFLPYFEENPLVTKLSFKAYTPYWNDGEVCEFSVHELQAWTGEDESLEDFDYTTAYSIVRYIETGVIDQNLINSTDYYLQPQKAYDPYNTYGNKLSPPKYASLDELLINDEYFSRYTNISTQQLDALQNCENELYKYQQILYNFPEDIIKDLFGDPAEVFITRDGIEVEECDAS